MLSRLIDKTWKLVLFLVLGTLIFIAALWYSILSLIGNEDIYNAITVIWALFIGFTIYRYGDVANKPRANTAGFAFMVFAIFLIIDRFEGFAVKISAFAALLVAFAAFMAIEENRHLREENRRLAVEERHMIAIEKIRIWAVETFHALATPNSHNTLPSWRREEIAKLQHSSVEATSILYFAEQVGGDLKERVAGAALGFQRYLVIVMGEERIELFKKKHNIFEDIKPINSIKEAEPLIEGLMDLLKEVIRSAIEELAPKR